MKDLIKQLLQEALGPQPSVGQTILGKTIVEPWGTEASNRGEKEIGFILSDDSIIGLRNVDYNEKTGNYIADSSSQIVYYIGGWDGEYKVNYLKSYSSLEDLKAEAIFPNKQELNKFYKLLQGPELHIKFKTNFNNVVTLDANSKEKKTVDLSRYNNFEFNYNGAAYTVEKSDIKEGYDITHINLSFISEGNNPPFSTTNISLQISYQYDIAGNVKKPNINISYYDGFPSKFVDIKTPVLDPLIKDILKQLK